MTGATGYVGGRLVPALLERDHEVRTTTTDPDREQPWWADRVETVVMDALDRDQVAAACEGVDAIYYLIHGMGGDDFAETDREAATNLAVGARAHSVRRIVYLSGLVPEVSDSELSEHITSRREVEQILSEAPGTLVVLRAAVILGSGSTSFEIIRQISERMPVQTVPTWMNSMVQPIAIVDVLQTLVGALEYAGQSRHFDVGGPDQLRYGELLKTESTRTGVASSTPDNGRALVSVSPDLVERLHVAEPSGLDEAIRRSLSRGAAVPERSDPMGPLPQDPAWASGGDDRPTLAKVVDAVKDVLPGSS